MNNPQHKKRCPFCGSMGTSVETFDEESRYWSVLCSECKCTGPLIETDLEIDDDGVPPSEVSRKAFEAWNKRRNMKNPKKKKKELSPYGIAAKVERETIAKEILSRARALRRETENARALGYESDNALDLELAVELERIADCLEKGECWRI